MSARTPACMNAVPPSVVTTLCDRSQRPYLPRGPSASTYSRKPGGWLASQASPRWGFAGCRALLDELGVVVERALTTRFRPGIGERGVARWRDIPELVEEVHDLVVAEEGFDPAARAPRLLLEPHQQVERFTHFGPAIEDVSGLHEDGRASDPLTLGVDEARGLQDFDELIEGAMHVADGDDARPRRLGCLRHGGMEGGRRQPRRWRERRDEECPARASATR